MINSGFSLEFAEADTRRWARSRDELAQILDCSLITVARMLKEPGNPGRTANGSYPVEKWKEYFEERKELTGDGLSLSAEDSSRLAAARIRREEARAAREELLLEKERSAVVSAQEVETAWSNAYEKIKQIFFAEMVEKETNEETFYALRDRYETALRQVADFFAQAANP